MGDIVRKGEERKGELVAGFRPCDANTADNGDPLGYSCIGLRPPGQKNRSQAIFWPVLCRAPWIELGKGHEERRRSKEVLRIPSERLQGPEYVSVRARRPKRGEPFLPLKITGAHFSLSPPSTRSRADAKGNGAASISVGNSDFRLARTLCLRPSRVARRPHGPRTARASRRLF